jgi:hypothetical protein
MNSEHVVFLEGGIISSRGPHQSFRSGRLNPLPFLFQPKPVAAGFLARPRHTGSTRDPVPRPTGWAEKVESLGVRIVAGVFVVVLLCAGLGAQHISYVRARNQLGRDLRQREQDLKTVTFAYRALEARKAVELAQSVPGACSNVLRLAASPSRPATTLARTGAPSAGRKAPAVSTARATTRPRLDLAKAHNTPKSTRAKTYASSGKHQEAATSRSRTAAAGSRG